MLRVLKFMAFAVITLVAAATLVFGAAWLLADRWNGAVATPAPARASLPDVGWTHYGNDEGGSRYSPATQVDTDNVGRLAPVWVFRTGETGEGYTSAYKHTFQATPILVDSTLFFSTAFNRVFAVDAETGEQRWREEAPPPVVFTGADVHDRRGSAGDGEG